MKNKRLSLQWLFNAVIGKVGIYSPDFVGRLLVNIPLEYSYGKAYGNFEKKIKEAEQWNETELEDYIVKNFDTIFQYAKKFKLYNEKYKKSGVLNLVVKSIEDIEKIPILTKKEIRQNMSEFKGHISAKTGGTTGNPLLLYLDKYSPAREWAHYHKIWEKVGYKYTDAKFSFRDLGSDVKFLKYDFQHNEYHINIWDIHEMTSSHIDEFFKILTIRNVKYFRGYPSAINDFLKEIEKKISRDQKEILQKNIICCFYNSEYPTPQIVYYLKNEWGLDFISGYGHTEMCVLAAAKINELDYYPFHTYGFTEVVDNMLIGTSYHNFDMPLIRYNTDDLVRAKRYANGIIRSFEVKEGRIIDFIFDKKNKKIPLTGLLNKIQHKVFSQIEYIQVFQKEIGFATIIVSQSNGDFIDAPSLLKLDYLDLDWDFIYLRKPIRTISGKVPLRVQKLP